MSTKLLIIEDDPQLSAHLSDVFKSEGFLVFSAKDQFEATFIINTGSRFDILLLDRLLGDYDSKSLLPTIKNTLPDARILVLSAINTPNERIELLNSGVDDYLGKPFVTQEVIARIKALQRRSAHSESSMIRIGETEIDLITRKAACRGQEVDLSAKEFLLLKTLASPPGRVLNKLQLLDLVWGANVEPETNVVEATITNLRRRLHEIQSAIKIKNMRNAGYWIES